MDETTNEILQSLRNDIALEVSAARGAGDAPAATALERLGNALDRNIARRAEREAADNAEEA